jgi:hypothetical protein
MPRLIRTARLLLAIAPCTAVGAQIPAHATLLSNQYSMLEPRIVQLGDVVHLFSSTLNTTSLEVFHWRSDDGGRTWPIHQQVISVSQSPLPNEFGAVDVVPGRALVLLGDRTLGPLLRRSTDAGSTWSAPIPVAATVVAQTTPLTNGMHVDGQVIVAAWTNDRPTGRVFANRSTDGGLTWQPTDVPLDVGTSQSWVIQNVRCIGAGPIVHVLWGGPTPGGYGTFHQRSTDGGITWRATPVIVANSETGRAATDGPNVILVDMQQGRFLRSADHGDTWAQLTNIGIAGSTDVRNEGSTFVVGGRAGSPLSPFYVVNLTNDGGQTWLVNPLSLPGPATLTPRVHFGGGRIWVNFRGGSPFLDALASADSGLTWQAVGGPVDAGFGASERRTIHVATMPTPNGPREYVYAGAGNTTLGAATPGTGNIAPSLTTVGLPLQGRTTTFRIDGAVGGAIGLLGASPAPPTPWQFGNATIWLGGTPALVAFVTSGASGAAGAGSFGLPCAVPVAPTLIGASLTAQALVLDGGAAPGFTVTNALEVWLR